MYSRVYHRENGDRLFVLVGRRVFYADTVSGPCPYVGGPALSLHYRTKDERSYYSHFHSAGQRELAADIMRVVWLDRAPDEYDTRRGGEVRVGWVGTPKTGPSRVTFRLLLQAGDEGRSRADVVYSPSSAACGPQPTRRGRRRAGRRRRAKRASSPAGQVSQKRDSGDRPEEDSPERPSEQLSGSGPFGRARHAPFQVVEAELGADWVGAVEHRYEHGGVLTIGLKETKIPAEPPCDYARALRLRYIETDGRAFGADLDAAELTRRAPLFGIEARCILPVCRRAPVIYESEGKNETCVTAVWVVSYAKQTHRVALRLPLQI